VTERWGLEADDMRRYLLLAGAFALLAFRSPHLASQAGPVPAQAVAEADLKYYCEDIPPSNYLEGGVVKGVSAETLRLIWKKMGMSEQPIRVVPWSRGYEIALKERNAVLFSMSRTAEREALFKWAGPIFTVRSVLLGRSGRDIELRSLEDARKYAIGVLKDDVMASFLEARGFGGRNLQSVSGLDMNFEKLELGRIDLIAHSLNTFDKFIEMHGLDPKRYRVYFVVSANRNFYAFNRETSDGIVAAFQKAFDSLSAERKAILAGYGLSE
jgi:polar amino acid transport system substrate-binding protein